MTDRDRGRNPPSPKRRRSRRLVVAVGASVLLAVAAATALYVHQLTRELDERWALHRWSLPSQVFAAPTTLYPGRELSRDAVMEELDALGYRRVEGGDAHLRAGQYRQVGRDLNVHLRDFVYPPPEGLVEGGRLDVRFAPDPDPERIEGLWDPETAEPVFEARLEPRQVAALFDARMVSRRPATLEEIPEHLVEAVLAVEDRRFRRHAGVDPVRVLGAALQNLRQRRLAQGASTLTQQLVKNYYLTPERTLRRKAREAVMALLLERRHTKDEILEAYLNEVYLGQDGSASVVGVGEAARHYFSRDVSRLDLAEAALLAGMIRAPNRYSPARHPERARQRRSVVLALMEEQGAITPEERREAEDRPLPAASPPRPVSAAPYFVDYVAGELGERFSREDLRREGLRIFTSLDPRAQRAAGEAVREGLDALERRYPWLRAHASAGTEGAAGPEAGSGAAGDADEGGRLLQAAFVALDPRTGDILALVGGRAYGVSQFDRATRARRQPGSLFKPFVYLAALTDTAGGWTLARQIPDTAFTVRAGGREWSPTNYDGEEHGMVAVREALERSHNIATAHLALEVGLPEVVRTARETGFTGEMAPVPSLALGAFEVSPLEIASAYAVLAGGGIRPEPLSVLRATTGGGELLEAKDLRMRRVAEAGPVYLLNRALQGVLREGTAAGAEELGYRGHAAGKTGTTSGHRDAWFVGYTPELVALVWVGFDDNRSLGLPGARAALPLWTRFMEAYGGERDVPFVAPEGVVEVAVDEESGLRARRGCGPWRMEVFLEGTAPEEECERDGWWIF